MAQPAYVPLQQGNRDIEEGHLEALQERASGYKCTAAKAKRAGLGLLEASFGLAVPFILFTNIPIWLKVVVPVYLYFGAVSCKEARKKIQDFEDPVELQSIKEDALRSTFHEVITKYTWAQIADYQLLPDGELARKCQLHVLQHFGSFSTCEVNEYLQRGLITTEQYAYFEAKNKEQYRHTLNIPLVEQPEEEAADPVLQNQQPE